MKKGRNSDMKKRRYTYLAGEDILLFKRRYTAFQKKIYCALAGSWMAGFLLMLLTLTACVGEELQKPLLGEGEGYLTLQIGAISAEIQTSPLTKTPTELDASLVPAPKDLTINIKNTNTQESVFTGSPTGESMTFSLKTGTYTVEAHYGKDSTLQETPYFHDSKDITIGSLTASEVSLTPSLANAMLVPVVDEDLKKHYSEWTLSVKVDSASQDLASNSMERNLYVQSGLPVEITFNGTNLINEKTSKTAQVTDAAQPRTQYTIQCNPENLPSFNLEATVLHTQDEKKRLNGTRVQVNVTKLEGTFTGAIKGWEAKLYNANNTLVRTYSASSAPSTDETKKDMMDEFGWPYLPHGEYTLRYALTLQNGESTAEHDTTITVSAPEFKVSASAYTSYNKYTNRDINGANDCDGSTIYAMQAVPTISDDLLNNDKYSQLKGDPTLTLDNSSVAPGNASSLSWGSHTLTATYTFDGATVSGSETYHVTGLPYSQKFKNENTTGWETNNTEYSANKFLSFKPTDASLLSPSFYVPDNNNIDVIVTTPVHAYHTYALVTYSPTLYVSASNTAIKSGKTKSFTATTDMASDKNEETLFKSETFDVSLSSNATHISLYVYGKEEKKYGLTDIGRLMMLSCSIEYK